jgi:hypothetical protein
MQTSDINVETKTSLKCRCYWNSLLKFQNAELFNHNNQNGLFVTSGVDLNFSSKLALESRLWTHHSSVCRVKTQTRQKVRLDLNTFVICYTYLQHKNRFQRVLKFYLLDNRYYKAYTVWYNLIKNRTFAFYSLVPLSFVSH